MKEKSHESIKTIRPLKDVLFAVLNPENFMLLEIIKLFYPKNPCFLQAGG